MTSPSDASRIGRAVRSRATTGCLLGAVLVAALLVGPALRADPDTRGGDGGRIASDGGAAHLVADAFRPAEGTPLAPDPPPPAPRVSDDPVIRAYDVARARIEELLAGTLDPDVDVRALLSVDMAVDQGPGAAPPHLDDLFPAPPAVLAPAPAPAPALPAPTSPPTPDAGPTDAAAASSSPDAGAAPTPDVVAAGATADTFAPEHADVPPPAAVVPPPPAADVPSTSIEEARARFEQVRGRYLSLSLDDQRRLLAAHDARRDAVRLAAAGQRSRVDRAAAYRSAAEWLRALQRGDLDPAVDVGPLLRIDLADADLVAALRRAVSGGTTAAGAGAAAADSGDDLAQAADERAAGLVVWFARPAVERNAVLARQTERARAAVAAAAATTTVRVPPPTGEATRAQKASDDAQARAESAAADEQAARDAAEKETERSLVLAGAERARILGVRTGQSRFEAALLADRTVLQKRRAEALAWPQRIDDLAYRLDTRDATATDADQLWPTLATALADARTNFAASMSALSGTGAELPRLTETGLDGIPESERGPLLALRDQVRAEGQRLLALQEEVVNERTDAWYEVVRTLNDSRLRLIPLLSPALRDRLTGFGPDGLAQVTGALGQATLFLRYRVVTLPRALADILARAKAAPLDAFVTLLKLIAALGVFLWWRRRGGAIVDAAIERRAAVRRPQTSTRLTASLLWHYRRVRGPLDWVVLLALVVAVVKTVAPLPEIDIAWTVARWLLIARIVVDLLDALAARFAALQPRKDEQTRLRGRSLRLVALTIVGVGLLFALTAETMGRGAFYAWVQRTSWLIAVPVILLLLVWWRRTIFRRLAAQPTRPPLEGWVVAHASGPLMLLAAGVGGALLLFHGLRAWAMTHVLSLPVLRRIHAWFFRREVGRRARLQDGDSTMAPLAPEVAATLAPDREAGDLVPGVYDGVLARLDATLRAERAPLIALIGERGIGKTTFLRRLRAAHEGPGTRSVACPPGGLAAVEGALAAALAPGDGGASTGEGDAPRLVLVDDAQRLVRPVIGGLADLDALCGIARARTPDTAWVVAVGAPAWSFVSRSRSAHALFDHVFSLGPWEDDDVVALLEARTAETGLAPRFESAALVTPMAGDGPVGEAMTPEQRYFRILWDYADGNPAVSLLFWRDSLRRSGADARHVVQLFEEPAGAEIEALPVDLLFVLRAIVQLEVALPADVGVAAALDATVTANAVRLCLNRGYVEMQGDRLRITWRWYRAITRTLVRQHLLTL